MESATQVFTHSVSTSELGGAGHGVHSRGTISPRSSAVPTSSSAANSFGHWLGLQVVAFCERSYGPRAPDRPGRFHCILYSRWAQRDIQVAFSPEKMHSRVWSSDTALYHSFSGWILRVHACIEHRWLSEYATLSMMMGCRLGHQCRPSKYQYFRGSLYLPPGYSCGPPLARRHRSCVILNIAFPLSDQWNLLIRLPSPSWGGYGSSSCKIIHANKCIDTVGAILSEDSRCMTVSWSRIAVLHVLPDSLDMSQ